MQRDSNAPSTATGMRAGSIDTPCTNMLESGAWPALVALNMLTASARCRPKSNVITINGKELMAILERNNQAGYVVMQNLSRVVSSRLAATMIALTYELQQMSAGRRT
jgi:hypothetical protein